MKNTFDAAIVGGGPVGSYTARQLAEKGFAVCVLDEKRIIGEGVICSGIISKEAFRGSGRLKALGSDNVNLSHPNRRSSTRCFAGKNLTAGGVYLPLP